jgi:2-keto-3-deoxy-L-rhamnonate aldolase RhmA
MAVGSTSETSDAGACAQQLARKLVRLADLAAAQEGCDIVNVSTGELCKAMGKPDGATMEEVKSFVLQVLKHLDGQGMTAACGCGFLALRVMRKGMMETAVSNGRDLLEFTPSDIDQYIEEE